VNPMDGPNGISLGSDCYKLGNIRRPADKTDTGGDLFFELSGRNLITMLTAAPIPRGSVFAVDVPGQLLVIEARAKARARRLKPKAPVSR
jgi:hypothetical protein